MGIRVTMSCRYCIAFEVMILVSSNGSWKTMYFRFTQRLNSPYRPTQIRHMWCILRPPFRRQETAIEMVDLA